MANETYQIETRSAAADDWSCCYESWSEDGNCEIEDVVSGIASRDELLARLRDDQFELDAGETLAVCRNGDVVERVEHTDFPYWVEGLNRGRVNGRDAASRR